MPPHYVVEDTVTHRNPTSKRWGDPRIKLLQEAQWEALRPQVCRALGHPDHAEPALHALTQPLDAAYRRTLANWPTNSAVRVERRRDRDTLVLTGLEKLEEPRSLITLRAQLQTRLPRIDLPDVLLAIHARTGCAQELTHIRTGEARVADLPGSPCAVLLAEACPIGLEPVVRPDVPALTRGRLRWLQQNDMRAEPLSRAKARLVATQTTLPFAYPWGGGGGGSGGGPAVCGARAHPQCRPQSSILSRQPRRHRVSFPLRSLHRLPGHRDSRDLTGGEVHPGWPAGTADEPAAARNHDRHRSHACHHLWVMLALGIPGQSTARRYRCCSVLASRSPHRLWGPQRDRTPADAHNLDRSALGRSVAGGRVAPARHRQCVGTLPLLAPQ
jgi:hypothetical protein